MCPLSLQANLYALHNTSVAVSTQPNHCQSNSLGFSLLGSQLMSVYYTKGFAYVIY